jgi:hypothetical protein
MSESPSLFAGDIALFHDSVPENNLGLSLPFANINQDIRKISNIVVSRGETSINVDNPTLQQNLILGSQGGSIMMSAL